MPRNTLHEPMLVEDSRDPFAPIYAMLSQRVPAQRLQPLTKEQIPLVVDGIIQRLKAGQKECVV